MKLKNAMAILVAAGITAAGGTASAVAIEVGYPYSALFNVTCERMMPDFKRAHPDIDVKFRATYENYGHATNSVLRESLAGDLPGVTF